MPKSEDKQHLADQVNRWITTIQSSKTLPTTDNPLLESPDWWKPEFVDPAVDLAIKGFRKSQVGLDQFGEDGERGVSGNSFVLPLGVILDALPERYLDVAASPEVRQRPIRVFLDDLFDQLTHGAVRVTIARLVFGVPAGFIASVALRDTETKVTLPLKAVVDAIGADALVARTANPGKRPKFAHLPELFTPEASPQAAPPQAAPLTISADPPATQAQGRETPAAVTQPAEPPLLVPETAAPPPSTSRAEDVALPAGLSALAEETREPAHPAAKPPAAPAEVHVSTIALERLNANGVDLNCASEAALLTISGITPAMAREIVAYRERHGRFANVFALADVPRVGRKTFRKITGMPYSRTHRHRGAMLARWLGLDAQTQVSLPALVRAVSAHPGLAGCVMSDRDGLLLAESGAGDQAATLSAIVPRLMGHVRDNIRELGGDGVSTVSIAYNGRLLTAVAAGDVTLTALHSASRLTTGLHVFLRRVALELAWWFSRRGYVVAAADSAGVGGHA